MNPARACEFLLHARLPGCQVNQRSPLFNQAFQHGYTASAAALHAQQPASINLRHARPVRSLTCAQTSVDSPEAANAAASGMLVPPDRDQW